MYLDSPLCVGDLDHEAISARIHSEGGVTGWEQSRNRELPPTLLAGGFVRGTVQAGRMNSRIDSRSERLELNDTDAFAGEIR